MRKALLVSDAWRHLMPHDLEYYPFMKDDSYAFGVYLNRIIIAERFAGTDIWYLCSSRDDIMPTIDHRQKDRVIKNISEFDIDTYECIRFCGFHMGRCIRKYVRELRELNNTIDIGILVNACMAYPYENFNDNNNDVSWYMWNHGTETKVEKCTN